MKNYILNGKNGKRKKREKEEYTITIDGNDLQEVEEYFINKK